MESESQAAGGARKTLRYVRESERRKSQEDSVFTRPARGVSGGVCGRPAVPAEHQLGGEGSVWAAGASSALADACLPVPAGARRAVQRCYCSHYVCRGNGRFLHHSHEAKPAKPGSFLWGKPMGC